MQTIKKKIRQDGYFACKNILKDKEVVILSCGPSIEEFKKYIKRGPNTVIATIKTATNYSKGNEDFFFYDKRLYDGHRTRFKYILNNQSIKVFTHDYLNEEKQKKLIVNKKIKKDIEWCINPKSSPIVMQDCKLTPSKIKNKMYYEGNLFLPIYIRAIVFFIHLGVRNFKLFGVTWYNKDMSTQAKHFEPWVQAKIGFDNLVGSFYSNILLKSIIKKYKLDIKVYANYSQIDISIPRINIKNKIFYQKSNFYEVCKRQIKDNKKESFNEHYFKILNMCKNSKFANEPWYKILILMVSKIKNYRFDKLKDRNFKEEMLEWHELLLCIGIACGM